MRGVEKEGRGSERERGRERRHGGGVMVAR